MEKIELPFNAEEMSEENKQLLADKINAGDICLMLEIRDKKGNLLGFQPTFSVDDREEIIKDKLNYFAHLNDSLHDSKFAKRKKILEEIKKCIKSIEYFYKYRCYLITGSSDIAEEIEMLEPYKKEEMLLSFEPANIKTN